MILVRLLNKLTGLIVRINPRLGLRFALLCGRVIAKLSLEKQLMDALGMRPSYDLVTSGTLSPEETEERLTAMKQHCQSRLEDLGYSISTDELTK